MSYMKLHQVEWSYLHSYIRGQACRVERAGISLPELFCFSTPPVKRDYLEQNIPPPLRKFLPIP